MVMVGGTLSVTVNAMAWLTLAPIASPRWNLSDKGKAAVVTAMRSSDPDAPKVTSAHLGPGTVNQATPVIATKVAIVNAVPR